LTTVARRRAVVPELFYILAVACCLLVLPIGALGAQQTKQVARTNSVIVRVDFYGTRRVPIELLRDRTSSRPGEPYNAQAVQRDAQAIRNTGFFDRVRVKTEDSLIQPNGKIVIFYLVERPIIRRIEYKGISTIAEEDIIQAYKRRNVRLSVGAYFDQTQLPRAAAVIKDLLAARGYPSASVKPSFEKFPRTDEVNVVFHVTEGPRAKRK